MVKYRRIKVDRIKRYAIATGIVGVPLVAVLFLLLGSLGAIEIISYTGDQVCAGTTEDPCIANIIFKAKTDIYIYPINESDQTALLQTDKKLKSIVLKRSWGKGYRTIYLNKTWNKNVKYALKLSKGQTYNFTFFAMKNSPYDRIKWAVNYEDREYLDPIWKSPYENSYTAGSETHCKDGVCNKILHSGIRFVEEDDIWKNVEDARSLKGSGIECVINSDGINLVECLDWNYTSIKLKLNQKSVLISKEVPIKIYEKIWDEEKQEEILSLKLETKESFSLFSNQKDKEFDFKYGDIIHFGEKSTIIQLQDNETENLLDTTAREGNPNDVQGLLGFIRTNAQGGYDNDIYIFFNISNIPNNAIILNSSLNLYFYNSILSDPDPQDLYNVLEMKSDSDGGSISDANMTWNNQPCGVNYDNSTYCNLTTESTSEDLVATAYKWINWTTTQGVNRSFTDGKVFAGFFIRSQGYGESHFYSKEADNLPLRPYLNITYTEEGEDTTNPTITWEIPTPTDGDTISQNYVYLNTTISDDSNTSAFFDWNKSLVGYLSMDNYNSTGVFDNSTYDNFGTFYNMSEDNKTDGQFGDAFYFSGNDYKSYIDMGNDSEMAISNDLSLDLWVKPAVGQEFCFNGTLGNFGILGSVSGADSTSTYSYQLRYGSANNCSLGWQINTAAGGKWVTLGYNLSTDTWSHIVTTFNGTDEKIYVNGILKNTTTFAATTISTNSNNKILLGVAGWGVSNTYYEGEIDEFKIFNRVLSQEEINASYNNGLYKLYHNFTDLSNGNYNYSAYAIDTSGNLEINNERKITISEDTCTYTSGTWERDCSENCTTDENVDLGGDDIVTTNAGFWYLAANISNYGNLNLSSGCNIVFDDNTFLIS